MSQYFNVKTLTRVAKYMAAFTAIFCIIEGLYYYAEQSDPFLRALLIFENTFQAFLLQYNVSLSDAIEATPQNAGVFRHFVLYGYAIACVFAPVCTAVGLYKTVELFFRRYQKTGNTKKGEPVIIFGWNEFAKSMALSAAADSKYNPFVKPGRELTQDEELEILKNRITIFDKADELGNELKQVKNVVLADLDIAADLAVLLDIRKKERALKFHDDCRYYIYYDDPGDRWISERVCQKAIADEGSLIENATDIEFFDLNEIAARKAIEKLPPYTYQMNCDWKDKNFHMLLLGFGQMGQQILLKAMNQAVFSSDSTIVIDVVDYAIHENSALFFNQFRPDYVKRGEGEYENEYTIRTPEADGEFKIRLYDADVRYHQFRKLLGRLIRTPEGKFFPFTYGMICLHDNAASIQSMMAVQAIIRDEPKQEAFPIAIRFSGDEKNNLFAHIEATVPQCKCVAYDKFNVTLEDIFRNEQEGAARTYNWIYNAIGFEFLDNRPLPEAEEGDKLEITENELLKKWNNMQTFQRNSSRALYEHAKIKEELLKQEGMQEKMHEAFGVNGDLLKRRGTTFYMEEDNMFLAMFGAYPELEELMKTEHRRWNYYMASQGWRYAKNKNVDRQENPCMTDWETLKKNRPDMCKYDLIPYLAAEHFENVSR